MSDQDDTHTCVQWRPRPEFPEPKHRRLPRVILGVATGFTAAVGAAGVTAAPAAAQHVIGYEVAGAGTADIRYEIEDREEHETVPLPWQRQFSVGSPSRLEVGATGNGPLTCGIFVNGQLRQQHAGNGEVECLVQEANLHEEPPRFPNPYPGINQPSPGL